MILVCCLIKTSVIICTIGPHLFLFLKLNPSYDQVWWCVHTLYCMRNLYSQYPRLHPIRLNILIIYLWLLSSWSKLDKFFHRSILNGTITSRSKKQQIGRILLHPKKLPIISMFANLCKKQKLWLFIRLCLVEIRLCGN
jgi:hypothetical protein